MRPFEPYGPRPISNLGLYETKGWRIKVYGIRRARPAPRTALEDRTATGPAACVWDIAVIGHERQVWIDTVLADAESSDCGAYLDRHLQGFI